MADLVAGVGLRVRSCGECGITFAVPEWFDDERRETGKGWYCPNGHSRIYRKTKAQQLEEELASQKQATERERKAAIDARIEAQGFRIKAERIERKLKRVRNGVCPECQRSFENLRRHMTSKHPGCVARAK